MEKKFYITTAIAYSNDKPHMGHAYEFFLSDVIARYKKVKGFDTYFLTGMDEHGMKNARAAHKNGMTPQAFVDEKAESFRELHKNLGISYDCFIRTSDRNVHWPGAELIWNKMDEAGDIYKKAYKGLYCVGCEKFITEKDLTEEGKCPLHSNNIPEEIEEENYFFRLSKYTDKIRSLIENKELEVVPESAHNEMMALLDQGLEDVSISRKEDAVLWGIPVPNDPSQLMYIWCDALTNYISALGYGREEDANFKKYWPADAHVIGKDIVRFHAALWPAMLISAGVEIPKRVLVHGFVTSDGKKMSKSVGNVVDPADILSRFGTEATRYFFGREMSPYDDSDFTEPRFVEAYNANLANGLGNLVSRTTKMAESYFEGNVKRTSESPVKSGSINLLGPEASLEGFGVSYTISNFYLPRYERHMEKFETNKAMDVIWEVISLLDGYVTDYEPYKLIKIDKEKTEGVIFGLLMGINEISKMLLPFMPDTSSKIRSLINAKEGDEREIISFEVKTPETSLFPRI